MSVVALICRLQVRQVNFEDSGDGSLTVTFCAFFGFTHCLLWGCHTFAYRLTYLRRIEIRKVRHTYVVDTWAYVAHTLRYVAHTPHTPRCYVFFLCVLLKIRSTYVAGPIRRTYVTHTWYIRKQRGRYVVDT